MVKVQIKRDAYGRSRQSSNEIEEETNQTFTFPSSPPLIASRKSIQNELPNSKWSHSFVMILGYVAALVIGILLLDRYLRYPVNTKVIIERPKETELPSISLCFFYTLEELNYHTVNTTNGTAIKTWPLKLSEINERLPKIDEWIINCTVLNATSYDYQSCLGFWNVTVEYLSFYSKCYSYFKSLMPQVYYDSKEVIGKWLLDVKFNISVIKSNRIGIYITHTYAELEESLGNPSFLQFDTTENNQAACTFERTAVRRLPSPYETECFEFENLDCKNTKTCMRHCAMNNSYHHYKSWNLRNYIKLRAEFMDGWFTNRSERDEYENCSRYYGQTPCNDYHYLAILTSEFKSEIQENDTFQLYVAYPTAPKIEVKFQPASPISDTLCFLGGQFYLWTGVSLLAIISSSIVMFNKAFISLGHYVAHKKNSKLQDNLRSYVSDLPSRPKISTISKGWTEQDIDPRAVRLNQFTSHGLSNFRSPER